MSASLKVPYAIDRMSGSIVKAGTASRSREYHCLDCQSRLVLKEGQERQKHFSHPPTSNTGCAGESLNHKAAKLLLAQQLKRDLENNGKVHFQQHCPGIEGECKAGSLIPDTRTIACWSDVKLEVAYLDFRLDVAIVNGPEVIFGFEVFHRHQVPEHKSTKLKIRWMELIADDILAFKPRVPYRHEVSKRLCQDCVSLQNSIDERKPEDQQRDLATSHYQEEASRLRETWTSILNDARKFSRESKSR